MSGGTPFHLVTDGIHAELRRAVDAANGQDVQLGGRVATMWQYVCAGLVDELHIAVSFPGTHTPCLALLRRIPHEVPSADISGAVNDVFWLDA